MKKIVNLIFLMAAIASIEISCSSDNDVKLYRIQENGIYGFIDSLGNEVIKPQYKYVSDFTEEGYATVISSINRYDNDSIAIKYGVINTTNKLVIDTTLVANIHIGENYIAYSENVTDSLIKLFNLNKLGFNAIIFNSLNPSNERIAFQDYNTKLWGYKNMDGKVIVEPKYKYVHGFSNGLSVVTKMGDDDKVRDFSSPNEYFDASRTWSIIDVSGEELTKLGYNFIYNFGSETTWAINMGMSKNDNLTFEYSLIDKIGNVILGPFPLSEFMAIYNGECNRYLVEANFAGLEFCNFINNKGDFIIISDSNDSTESITDFSFNIGLDVWPKDVTSFSEDICGMKVNYQNKIGWMFMDKDLQISCYEVYDSIGYFSEGLAAVKQYSGINEKNDDFPKGSMKWGFVDHEYNLVIPYKFSEVGKFRGSLCYFRHYGTVTCSEGYINRLGEIVWQVNTSFH